MIDDKGNEHSDKNGQFKRKDGTTNEKRQTAKKITAIHKTRTSE